MPALSIAEIRLGQIEDDRWEPGLWAFGEIDPIFSLSRARVHMDRLP